MSRAPGRDRLALDDALAFLRHEFHLARRLEVPRLIEWLGDVHGKRVLDVAGGDGYWSGRLHRLGATPFMIDIATARLARGQRLRDAPMIAAADAHRLPFSDHAFDAIMSVCALEHFTDGAAALVEMHRVVKPGGVLVVSIDALTGAARWPGLDADHRRRYSVVRSYTVEDLESVLDAAGFRLERSRYLFRGAAQHLYLVVSRRRVAWNLASTLVPAVALSDRLHADDGGSILLARARRAD